MNDRNDRGLSDALGAVVLISVVALGVTLFGVAILSGPLPDRIPALNAEVTNTTDTVFIRHTGGDTLIRGEYRILVDGSDRTSDFLSGIAVPAQWSVGDTLEYHLQPNEEIPSSIHITAITGKSEYVILQVQVRPPTLTPTYTVTSTVIVTTATTTTVPPPVADFSANQLSGTRPLPVQFTDTSTNLPSSWSWNFGDGGTSTLRSPSHTYLTAGTYTVTLTAANAGGSDSETKTGYITVINPPPGVIFADNFDAAFSGWTTSGDVSRYTGTPHNGTYGVRIRDTGGMTRTIPTTGYSDITVSFSMGADNLESGEYVVAEWSDGTTWQVLKQINNGDSEEDNALHPFSYTLPANAGNNAVFSLRFRVLGSNPSDHGYFDDIVVSGIPL